MRHIYGRVFVFFNLRPQKKYHRMEQEEKICDDVNIWPIFNIFLLRLQAFYSYRHNYMTTRAHFKIGILIDKNYITKDEKKKAT